ncbi:MAG: T9SS type A sorting domain-containing protein [Saprospiraceae bacterium]|nr:T9SS type A sorting domain-containing protein [Saprospiraceae bacterium]
MIQFRYFTILLFTLLSVISSPAQSGKLWEEYRISQFQKDNYPEFSLLKAESSGLAASFGPQPVEKAVYLALDAHEIEFLLQSKPAHFSLQLVDPEGRLLQLLMTQQVLFGANSKLLVAEGSNSSRLESDGLFYRGVVSGVEASFVALSIFGNEIAGVIALPATGNLVIGKLASTTESNANLHVLYADKDLLVKPDFQCGTSDEGISKSTSEAPETIYTDRCKTVKIFLECDYKLYQYKGRNVTNVKNYVTSLFNVVKTLYFNDGVNIEISDIMVWNAQDPFLHTDLASILYHYSNYRRNNFTGNLAQLVSTFAPQQQGGIAFLGTLCQPYNGSSGPHSFAYIYNSFSQLPAYSWSVEVMAHELGHNFGSPHTHACFWGPNRNQVIDNCQPPENNGCSSGPPPNGGGTIMSYCHLTGYGINFSKGFGPEPAEVIRIAAQNRSCVAASFIPEITPSITGPYFEDDVLRLKARPSNSKYEYDWFHYDYLMPTPKDSTLTVKYSGVYKSAISNNCTEYSANDTIEISDFLVNLGCPLIKGVKDSVQLSINMIADFGTRRDSLIVPDSLYAKVPTWARDVLVVLDMTIRPMGTSWTRDVTAAYDGPAHTAIANTRFNPNVVEPAGYQGVKTYSRILGNFNPAGTWHFVTNDNRLDAGVDGTVDFAIKIQWRQRDSIPPCEKPLCEGQVLTLDPGIRNGKYKWSTGDTTHQLTIRDTGIYSLEVSRGNQKSQGSIRFYHYPALYSQALSICDGDSLIVGKNTYKSSGNYTDTLLSITGCDSILNTELMLKPNAFSQENLYLCYADSFMNKSYHADAIERFHFTAANGCDSTHEVTIKVNPQLNLQTFVSPDCPEKGGQIEAIASGGSGLDYTYLWSNGKTTALNDSLASGAYEVEVTDSAGCKMRQEVELNNLDSVKVVPLVFDVDCFGDKNGRIFLDFTSGRAPFTVFWNTGANTKDLMDVNAGIYTAFIRDANACQTIQMLEVKSPELLFVQVDVKGSTGNDGSAKAEVTGGNPPYTYLWSNGERVSEIFNLAPGGYKVWIDDSKGCKTQSEIEVPQVTSTEVRKPEFWKIFIYPNPAKDHIVLTLNGFGEYKWSLFSLDGRPILSGDWPSNVTQQLISVESIHHGIYILEIRNEFEKREYHKVVVKN